MWLGDGDACVARHRDRISRSGRRKRPHPTQLPPPPLQNWSFMVQQGRRDTHKGCRYCYDTGAKNRGEGSPGVLASPKGRKQSGGRRAGEASVKGEGKSFQAWVAPVEGTNYMEVTIGWDRAHWRGCIVPGSSCFHRSLAINSVLALALKVNLPM